MLARGCRIKSDMLGPFYLAGAPYRQSQIVCAKEAESDRVITVSGFVLSADCSDVIPGAVLDIWQASSDTDGAT